jgi:hypothetical protein
MFQIWGIDYNEVLHYDGKRWLNKRVNDLEAAADKSVA